ncbi:MAG: ABC transporter substrate-binding protein [Stappiaceae bacterium]
MRHIFISALIFIALLSTASRAHSFEIEAEQEFKTGRGLVGLRVISTADLEIFAPLIEAFQARNPHIDVQYFVASSGEVQKAILNEGAKFDIAISSAMDLQTKLANDGYALTYNSAVTETLPDWARWRDQIFAFTQEPAVLMVSRQRLAGLPLPTNRQELIDLLRDHPETFEDRIGTYDIRQSGLGYLFATQDARNSESYWRLTEVMGRLGARLYCCSGEMIADIGSGKLALAYNVLGSYVSQHLSHNDGAEVIILEDYAHVMLRTALIPTTAQNFEEAGTFVDFLVAPSTRSAIALTGLSPLDPDALIEEQAFRPIRLGPGLLSFLDRMKRQSFLRAWKSAIVQQ